MSRAIEAFPIAQWMRHLIGALLLMALGACGGGSGSAAPVAPVITQQPASQTVESGKSVTFSVALQDATGATFQWLRNGVEISGAGQASHTLASAAMADSGTGWSVRVGNAGGTVTSAVATLTVRPAVATQLGASLFTGSIAGTGNLDGTGSEARLADPGRFAIGTGDVIYVSDRSARILRKISATGEVSGFVGTEPTGATVGLGLALPFVDPYQVVLDAPRNLLYVADAVRIQRVTLDGRVTTFATNRIGTLDSIAVGPDGALYTTTGENLVGFNCCMPTAIQKFPADGGAPVLLAGSPLERVTVDGNATVARFDQITALAVDASGNVYAAELGAIRKVAPDGSVSTLAGSATRGFVDGSGSQARFDAVSQLILEPGGSLLAYDSGNKALRRINAQGAVSTVARDLPNFRGMGIDSAGRIAFSTPHAVQRLAPDGSVQNIAGTPEPSAEVAFTPGYGLVVDSKGNVYTTVVDDRSATESMAIRKYAPTGERVNFGPAGDVTIARRTGSIKSFWSTLAIDGADNIYEADRSQGIFKITPDGSVTLLVSRETVGPTFATALLTANASGTLFAVDETTGRLFRITPAGQVTLMSDLRTAIPPYGSFPHGIAADNDGVVYLSNMSACTVHRIDPNGSIRLLAGRTLSCGLADGTGSNALFNRPHSLAVDSTGNVYVRDLELVRRIAPDGSVTTVAGIAGQRGTQIGAFPRALGMGDRLAVGRDDVLYVESGNALLKLRLK